MKKPMNLRMWVLSVVLPMPCHKKNKRGKSKRITDLINIRCEGEDWNKLT
jgi:hypothetical protein